MPHTVLSTRVKMGSVMTKTDKVFCSIQLTFESGILGFNTQTNENTNDK